MSTGGTVDPKKASAFGSGHANGRTTEGRSAGESQERNGLEITSVVARSPSGETSALKERREITRGDPDWISCNFGGAMADRERRVREDLEGQGGDAPRPWREW